MRSILISALLFLATAASARNPYPDAWGFGAKAQVGLAAGAYTVYSVTNANNTGAGSARACLEATGNRICVLKTGGTVALETPLVIDDPNVYFAGQRAPAGFQFTAHAAFDGFTDIPYYPSYYVLHMIVTADDVVIRNVRFRHSDPAVCVGAPCHWHFSVMTLNDSDRVLYDQISSSWATEDAFDIGLLTSTDGPNDITVQRSIIGQSMYVDSAPPGPSSLDSEPGHTMHSLGDSVSLIRNYFPSTHRFPNMDGGGEQESINNVIHSTDYVDAYTLPVADCGGATALPTEVHFIGNQWYKATGNASNIEPVLMLPQRNCTGDNGQGCDGLTAYFSGNRSYKNTDPNDSQALHVKCNWRGIRSENCTGVDTPADCCTGVGTGTCNGGGSITNLDCTGAGAPAACCTSENHGTCSDMGCSGDESYTLYEDCEATNVSAVPLFTGYAPPPILAIAGDTAATVVAGAGAKPRDAVDTCLAAMYVSGAGARTETVAAGCNGGPDTFAAGTWCSTLGGDVDADSMCDGWETTHFGDLTHTGSADTDGDGWSDLEEFLNDSGPELDNPPNPNTGIAIPWGADL